LLIIVFCSLKEKDRTGKKVAKTEKEKKDKESQEKARSMMANFFGKPKASSTATSPSKGPPPSTSSTLPEFERVFRAFTLKKDAELAPVNWLQEAKRRKQYAGAEMIVIDEDDTGDHDVEMSEPEPGPGANTRRNVFFIGLLAIH
jgi:chromatin assembly factor 1 subunit A